MCKRCVVIASNAFVRIGLHGIRGRRWKRRGEGMGWVGSAPSWLRVNKRGRNNFAFGISTAEREREKEGGEKDTGFRRADYFRPVFWQFRYSGQTLYGRWDPSSDNDVCSQ